MHEYLYQRQVIAYHGCDRTVADKVLLKGEALAPSEKNYDWLGRGIYFWEHGPNRALEWAEDRKKHGKVVEPAVIGAILHLGNCFDLLDTRHTETLQRAWSMFVTAKKANSERIPRNRAPKNQQTRDRLLRYRDCAVINWTISEFEKFDVSFDSVRGVFQEDVPTFEDSGIRLKSHIQIAVRNPACIIGYFRPTLDEIDEGTTSRQNRSTQAHGSG